MPGVLHPKRKVNTATCSCIQSIAGDAHPDLQVKYSVKCRVFTMEIRVIHLEMQGKYSIRDAVGTELPGIKDPEMQGKYSYRSILSTRKGGITTP